MSSLKGAPAGYGYVPGARKYAYLGDWLGSAGPLPLDGPKEFVLVDESTGHVALRGTPTLRMPHDRKESPSTSSIHNLTGEDVYELDFSAFNTPGRFFLSVPGVGSRGTKT